MSDVGGCVSFDPPAARPGQLVTIVPAPPDDVIPIIGECPPGGKLELTFTVNGNTVGVPLRGTDERATFRVPRIPAGAYVVGPYCFAINLGFDLDPPFVVLAAPDTSTVHANLPNQGALPSGGAVLIALSVAFSIGFGFAVGRVSRRRRQGGDR
jgi:hypothetical protein